MALMVELELENDVVLKLGRDAPGEEVVFRMLLNEGVVIELPWDSILELSNHKDGNEVYGSEPLYKMEDLAWYADYSPREPCIITQMIETLPWWSRVYLIKFIRDGKELWTTSSNLWPTRDA